MGLSPPQPAEKVAALRGAVLDRLKTIDTGLDLRNALVPDLLEAVRMSGIQSWFLEWEDRFSGWEHSTGSAQRLLLSDAQKEVRPRNIAIWIKESLTSSQSYGRLVYGPLRQMRSPLLLIRPQRTVKLSKRYTIYIATDRPHLELGL